VPPHRFHNGRRIERAKTLLAKPAQSVTEIGFTVGFSEASSFTAAFRKETGLTPSPYAALKFPVPSQKFPVTPKKFPVPLRREFYCNHVNSLAD
jgi:AraC-like DNA-binding protein